MKHGGFGFHPIWINIDQFFNSQHIEAIKNEIQRQQALSQISIKTVNISYLHNQKPRACKQLVKLSRL